MVLIPYGTYTIWYSYHSSMNPVRICLNSNYICSSPAEPKRFYKMTKWPGRVSFFPILGSNNFEIYISITLNINKIVISNYTPSRQFVCHETLTYKNKDKEMGGERMKKER